MSAGKGGLGATRANRAAVLVAGFCAMYHAACAVSPGAVLLAIVAVDFFFVCGPSSSGLVLTPRKNRNSWPC